MDWESSDVVRLYLGPLLQGQLRLAKLKSAYNSLIIGPRGLQKLKPTYRKSWTGNLQMWSDLTLGPFFKVKQWVTDFWCVFFPVDTNLHRFSNLGRTWTKKEEIIFEETSE